MAEKERMYMQQTEAIEWVAEQMPGGFFVYHADEKQEIIYVNQAACSLYGKGVPGACGQHVSRHGAS